MQPRTKSGLGAPGAVPRRPAALAAASDVHEGARLWLALSGPADGEPRYAVFLGQPILDTSGTVWCPPRDGRRLMWFSDARDVAVLRAMVGRRLFERLRRDTPVEVAAVFRQVDP